MLIGCSSFLFPSPSYAQPGKLDPQFGIDGKLIRNIGVSGMDVVEVLQQPDGKILFAGYASFTNTRFDLVLVRLNTDGSRDAQFGNNGIVTTDLSGDFDELISMVLLSTGKILVLGSGSQNAIVRYNADGTLDNGFNGDGILELENSFSFTDLIVQADGKIVVAAQESYAPEFIVMRFSAAGVPDSTFDSDGKKIISLASYSFAYASALAVQGDGKILVAGTALTEEGDVFVTVRLTTSGMQDMSFSSGQLPGVVVSSVGPDWEEITKLMVQADGKIVIGGYGFDLTGTMQYSVFLRYHTGGLPDSTFHDEGILHIGKGTGFFSLGKILPTADEKMVLTGIVRNEHGVFSMALARILSTGQMDNTFGTNGIVSLPNSLYSQLGVSVFSEADGHYLLAGFEDSPDYFHAVIKRVQANGTPDVSFGNEGTAWIPMGNAQGDDVANAVVLANEDEPIVVGNYNKGLENGGFIYQFSEDGEMDNSFGHEGKVYLHSSFSTTLQSVARQPDGKLLVTGTDYDLLEGAHVLLSRFHSNGKPDSSFGIHGRVITTLTPGSDVERGLSVGLQSDGRVIVLAGKTSLVSSSFYLLRYTSAGVLDESFGTGGVVVLDMDIQENGFAGYTQRLAIQPDNKILVTGEKMETGNNNIAVRRYMADGSIDASFHGGNLVTVDFNGAEDCGYALSLQADGKIVVTGSSISSSTMASIALVRLLSNGERDLSFSGDGRLELNSEASVFPSALAIQADGKILVSGTMSDGMNNTKMAVARWHQAGIPDSTWGENGVAVIGSSGDGRDVVLGMALQSIGKVLVYGKGSFQHQDNMILYRLQNTVSTGAPSFTVFPSNLHLSPNPVRDGLFSLRSTNLMDGDYQISIRSGDGKLLAIKKVVVRGRQMSELFSTVSFPSGSLWLTIEGMNMRKTIQFVKQ